MWLFAYFSYGEYDDVIPIHLTMTFRIESLMLFATGSQPAYSGVLRLVTTLETKAFKK